MEKIKLPSFGSGTATLDGTPKIKLPPLASFQAPVSAPIAPTPPENIAFNTSPFSPVTTAPETFKTTTPAIAPEPGIFEKIGQGAIDTLKHPLVTLGGVEKGVMDFTFNITKGIAGLAGNDVAKKYIADNQDAVNEIFNSNLKDQSEETAGVVGQFVGAQIPYILGGEVATALGLTAATAGLGAVGGDLSLQAISRIGALTRLASNVVGFVGLHQLEFQPEEGSRRKALGQDLLVLGVLEGLGAGLGAYANAKSIRNARSFLEEIKTEKPPLSEVEGRVTRINSEIKTETGKTPQELITQGMKDIKTGENPRINLRPQIPEGKPFSDIIAPEKTAPVAPESIQTGVLSKTEAIPTPSQVVAPGPQIAIPKIEPVPVSVSRSQLPVGTGEEVLSRLEARIKGKLDALTPEERLGLSTYHQMNKVEQIKAAVKYVSENPDEALQVLKGEKPAPKGLLNNSIFLAMEEKAAKDSDLALKLASLRSTRAGQEISILTERDPHSPVRYMTDLQTAKIEALGGKEKLAVLRKAEIETVKKAIRKPNLTKTDWNAFIDSITC